MWRADLGGLQVAVELVQAVFLVGGRWLGSLGRRCVMLLGGLLLLEVFFEVVSAVRTLGSGSVGGLRLSVVALLSWRWLGGLLVGWLSLRE